MARPLPAVIGVVLGLTLGAGGAACAGPSAASPPVPAGLGGGPAPGVVGPRAPSVPRFGFWGLNGHVSPEGFADLKQRFGMGIFQVASEDPAWAVGHLLPMVRAAGLQVTLRLTGDHDRYTTLGAFDLGAWKAELDRWDPEALAPFIADGTLAGHMLLDDIAAPPLLF